MVEWLKEHNTVEAWALIVAIATFIVSSLAYRFTRKSEKRRMRNHIAAKQARLKGLEEHLRWGHVETYTAAHLKGEIAALNAEIEELKSQL